MKTFWLMLVVVALWSGQGVAAPAATGSVEGTVRLKTGVHRVHHSANPYGSSHAETAPAAETTNCVVFLEVGKGENFPPPTQHARMDQKGEAFVPHVLPILVGTVVDFYNSDPFYHNVFSLSPLKKFDLGRYPKGERRSISFGLLGSVRFDQPGVVPIFCEIHSHMNGFIVILTSPWYKVPDASGHFALREVPPGKYRLRVWHDQLGERTAEVTVTAGATAKCDVTL